MRAKLELAVIKQSIAMLAAIIAVSLSAFSFVRQQNFLVTISAISISAGGESLATDRYKPGEKVQIKITMTNTSTSTMNVPKGEDYSRPQLLQDGRPVAYRREVAERIERQGRGGSSPITGFLFLKPNQPQSDVIDLDYWYEPLKPGHYHLYLQRVFFKQGAWSNTVYFEVGRVSTVTHAVKPAYPALAAARNVYGIVQVDVQIDAGGKVRKAAPVSGPSLLRPAAKDAALRWRFDGVETEGGLRSARLTFIFHSISYVPKKGETDFTPPYQMAASWEGIAAGLTKAHSAPLPANTLRILRLEVDGKQLDKPVRVILNVGKQVIEPTMKDDVFVLPAGMRKQANVGVRVLCDKYDLFFDRVAISSFDVDWIVGVDHKPFTQEYVEPETAARLRLLYYISFIPRDADGSRLVVRVHK